MGRMTQKRDGWYYADEQITTINGDLVGVKTCNGIHVQKLGKYEDIDKEIGIKYSCLFEILKNGFYDIKKDKQIKQCYVTYVDNEWIIVDLNDDIFYYIKEHDITWRLYK